MRTIEVDDRDYDDETVGIAHWRGAADTIFETIDEQLEPFGLEIIIIDSGSSEYMWRIERRSE